MQYLVDGSRLSDQRSTHPGIDEAVDVRCSGETIKQMPYLAILSSLTPEGHGLINVIGTYISQRRDMVLWIY